MKQIILICFVFSSLCGCKKSNDSPKNYFRITIDGIIENTPNLEMQSIPSNNSLFIKIKWSGAGLDISLNPYDFSLGEKNIVANPSTSNISPRFSLYYPDQYYAGDNGWFSGNITGSGKINILEINNNYVKGTFEFVSGLNPITNKIKTITNGEFQVKR